MRYELLAKAGCALVEKDWLVFGHPFVERAGLPSFFGRINMIETVKEVVEGENGLIDDVVVETVEESAVVENGLNDDVVLETVIG
nr:phosphatidylinositol-3-phosphatase myotubularin-1-like isoform X2 [Tanacetum cinerariifolium]